MLKVILTKGLPGSGKTVWSKKILAENPGDYCRVNKDDLRAMLHNGRHSPGNERIVLDTRDAIIKMAIDKGKHVIVDDTNLAKKHEDRIRQLVKGRAEVVMQDFTDVPVEKCIERDLNRDRSVGERVIRKMYRQFLMETEVYNESRYLPKAIIVDIDGTLAIKSDRSPYDWDRVKEDTVHKVIRAIVNDYYGRRGTVLIFSGRDGRCRKDTVEWLVENGVQYNALFMRDAGNTEKDAVIKRRLFEENVRGRYLVEYVLDDRNQVVEMWRNMGLTCLQVADGDF